MADCNTTVLHPQRRMEYLKMINWDEEWMNDAEKTLYNFWDTHYKPAATETLSEAVNVAVSSEVEKDFNTLAQYDPQLAATSVDVTCSIENPVNTFIHAKPDPLRRKVNGKPVMKKIDPLRYHYQRYKKAPDAVERSFHQCAMDISAVPAHTADLERSFSDGGEIATFLRLSMKDETFRSQTMLRLWHEQGMLPSLPGLIGMLKAEKADKMEKRPKKKQKTNEKEVISL
ncbi:hypothetical protein BT69DRAFT_1294167 [Atractiella rhizophila]|nr:hypothetical protein BT69DRAFT_1294167 [Atractiella rhizophila]